MKKIYFVFAIILFSFLLRNSYADPFDDLYEKISEGLKQSVSALTWVDINPIPLLTYCHFVIRYFPCNTYIQHQIDKYLPEIIKKSSSNCSWISQGKHQHTEGYCTLKNVLVKCQYI